MFTNTAMAVPRIAECDSASVKKAIRRQTTKQLSTPAVNATNAAMIKLGHIKSMIMVTALMMFAVDNFTMKVVVVIMPMGIMA